MGNTLRDRLMKTKHDNEVKYVDFFNDGSSTTDCNSFVEHVGVDTSLKAVSEVLEGATRSYSYDSDFDLITMTMLLGLVFDKKYVNEDGSLVDGAEPLKNVVRYYTGHVSSYLNGEQTNRADYYNYGVGRQGYIDYATFVKLVRSEGLVFSGPESFEEFKQLILSKVPFDISITAVLKQEQQQKMLLEQK